MTAARTTALAPVAAAAAARRRPLVVGRGPSVIRRPSSVRVRPSVVHQSPSVFVVRRRASVVVPLLVVVGRRSSIVGCRGRAEVGGRFREAGAGNGVDEGLWGRWTSWASSA